MKHINIRPTYVYKIFEKNKILNIFIKYFKVITNKGFHVFVHKLATLTADKNCKKLMPDMKRHHTLAKSHASILA